MIVTIHQPEHLPWLGYFHKMALADLYVILDCTQFRHRYFQNRNKVLGGEGPVWLTVPVRKLETRYGLIKDQLIDNNFPWAETYWGIIYQNYRKHPYFDRHADELRGILDQKWESLPALNYRFIDFFRRELGIATPLRLASEIAPEGLKSDLMLDISRRCGAEVYLSGPSGRDYLEEEDFKRDGIAVWYHDFSHPAYLQHRRSEFAPYLSTLDLLLNHGPGSRQILGLDAVEAERTRFRTASNLLKEVQVACAS